MNSTVCRNLAFAWLPLPLLLSLAPAAEPGLVAHWSFDEGTGTVARDLAGNGHDAILKNIEWIPSPRGHAVRFDGKEDLARYGGLESMNLEGDLTLAVWVKADPSAGRDTHRLIFGDGGPAIERNVNLQLDGSNALRFEWADGKGSASLTAPGTLLNGTWKHVAIAAASREKSIAIYADGEEVARMAMPFPISKTPVRDRQTGWFYNGYFQGELDDVRLYNRALEPAEIRRLFESEADVQAGRAAVWFETTEAGLRGISSVPVRNWSRESRLIKRSGAGAGTREIVLAPGMKAELVLGEVALRPVWSNRRDLYVCQPLPETMRPTLTVQRGDQADSLTPGLLAQTILEPMRVELKEPWQAQMPAGQTERLEIKWQLAISAGQMARGRMRIQLVSREDGRELLSREIDSPAADQSLSIDVRTLPWGAYDLGVSFLDGSGREVASTRRTATILPGGKQQIRPLNNLVSELMDARARGLLEERKIEFMNPRDGWVWFRAEGNCSAALGSTALLSCGEGGAGSEAMRLLPAGRHVLSIAGKPSSLRVRAIPALVYNVYPSTPMIAPFGANTWERLSKHMLPNCNMIESPVVDPPEYQQWRGQGKLWVTNVQAPGLLDEKEWSADRLLEIWLNPGKSTAHAERPGLEIGKLSGIQVDEYYPGAKSTRSDLLDATALSIARLSESPAFAGKLFIPFFARTYGATAPLFLKTLLGAGWPFSEEVYVGEMPTEAENLKNIRTVFLNVANSYETAHPGSLRRMIFTPMYAYLPYCTANRYPQADFRVHLDLQMQMLASEPAFFGLWGVQPYRSNYVDEEILHCMAKLLRHYCIEGRTDRMLADPYELRHVIDPDFTEGTRHWEVVPAEEGAVSAGRFAGYGQLQGRYPPGDFGDTFLLLKRSARGPNGVSQELRGLNPGRLYSIKVITGDHADLLAGTTHKQAQALAIRVEGAEVLPGGFSHPFPSARGPKPFTDGRRFWMTYHWLRFRAKEPGAKLRISDWTAPGNPGGPVGQEVLCSFVEVQPVFQ